MAEWDNDIILSFLEMYKNEPILWDPNHAHNKDKKRTGDAWIRISECIDIPVGELKRKKESLMATFRSHLRRKNAGIKSGVSEDYLHKPVWYAYEFMEQFLAPAYNQKKVLNSQSKLEFIEDDDFSRPETSTSSDFVTESRSAALQEAESSAVLRRRCQSPELPEAKRQMTDVFSLLNSIIAERTSVKEDDEYDLYGKLIAKRIRKLPEHERDFIMHDIDSVFVKRHHKYNTSVLSSSDIQEQLPLNATAYTATLQMHTSPSRSPPKFSSHSITQSAQIESDLLTQNTSN